MIDSRLPLTDIHRHLDGNIRAQTILELGRQFNLALPANELAALLPHVQITHTEPDSDELFAKAGLGGGGTGRFWTPAVAWPMKTWKMRQTRGCTTPSCVSPLLHGDEAPATGGWRGGSSD